MMTFLVALTSCAPVVAPASRPLTENCLDVQGQRELLAGFELELGDERAKTAECKAEATQSKVGYALGGGILGLVIGAVVGGITVSLANK